MTNYDTLQQLISEKPEIYSGHSLLTCYAIINEIQDRIMGQAVIMIHSRPYEQKYFNIEFSDKIPDSRLLWHNYRYRIPEKENRIYTV